MKRQLQLIVLVLLALSSSSKAEEAGTAGDAAAPATPVAAAADAAAAPAASSALPGRAPAHPTADSSGASTQPLHPHEAARAAVAKALSRTGALVMSASPAPRYLNYSLSTSRDTFEICKNQSGLHREIPLEELLPIYGLPAALLEGKSVSTATLAAAIRAAAPTARLVTRPLDAGAAELEATPDGPGDRLPKLVHFTVRDKNDMLPHQALSIASWARLNPGHSILLYDDVDIRAFITTYHAHHLPLFHRLQSQVERTDLWRYLVLCTFGGVYADSDVVAGRPIATWAQDAGLLTGVENAFETMAAARRRDYTRVMQLVQWTIAARRGHEVVCRMGDYISRRLDAEAAGTIAETNRDHAILERTGPGIWSSSVHDYLRERRVIPETLVGGGRAGDVRILPQSVFGCASNTVNIEDPMAYVYHSECPLWGVRGWNVRGWEEGVWEGCVAVKVDPCQHTQQSSALINTRTPRSHPHPQCSRAAGACMSGRSCGSSSRTFTSTCLRTATGTMGALPTAKPRALTAAVRSALLHQRAPQAAAAYSSSSLLLRSLEQFQRAVAAAAAAAAAVQMTVLQWSASYTPQTV